MKNKGLFVFLLLLFILAAGGAGLGYYYNTQRGETKPTVPGKVKVAYLYYLEDQQVENMPTNEKVTDEEGNVTTKKTYIFSKYSCTNELSGEFDEENWKFVPATEKDSTCSLYFVNSSYSVDFTVVNGTVSEDNPKTINREESGEFVIIPHDGYEFKEAICTNGKEATWNAKTNTLSINAITESLICKVNFSVKSLTAKFTVVNGTGNATETVEYGESVNAIVEANDGYEKPKIECSNKQTATFEDNKVTIEKLTNNTECKITFSAVPVAKHKFTIGLPNEVTIISGSSSQDLPDGKDFTFTLETAEGFTHTLSCGDVKPSSVEEIDSYKFKYTFLAVTKDIACEVKAIRSEE